MKKPTSDPLFSNMTNDEWNTLEAVLRPYILNCVYAFRLTHWHGAERELTEDILSETILRAIPYVQRAQNSAAPPIRSFEALCKTIAKHYLLDLRRKDKRLAFSIDTIPYLKECQYIEMSDDPADNVVEDLMVYSKMLLVSKVIKDFAPKLKEAMLVHLANQEDFDDDCPQPLEQAMWAVGIPLRDYYRSLPRDPVLRSRHNALVCLAYRKLRLLLNNTFSQPTSAA